MSHKNGDPTPTPQLVSLQFTVKEAAALHHLAAEALKYGLFNDPGEDIAQAEPTWSALKKIHSKLIRFNQRQV